MKKILFLFATLIAFTLSSCTKETTYVVSNNTSDLEGLTVDIRMIEYDGNGSKVAVNAINNVKKGDKKEFVANNHAEKLVCQLYWDFGSTNKTYYVANVFYLEEGKTIEVTLDDHTMISGSNPL